MNCFLGALQEWWAPTSCLSGFETTSSSSTGRVKIPGFISCTSEIQNNISGTS